MLGLHAAWLALPLAAAGQGKPMPKEHFTPLAGVPHQLWRYTLKMQLPDLPAGLATGLEERRFEVCNPEARAAVCNWDPECRNTELARDGLEQRIRLECPDSTGEAVMTWSADGKRFAGYFKLKEKDSPDDDIEVRIDAVYLRPCGPADVKR